MPHPPLERLREKFQQFADSIIWSNNDGSEKYIGVGNMADWWIEEIKLLLKEKREAVEKCWVYEVDTAGGKQEVLLKEEVAALLEDK